MVGGSIRNALTIDLEEFFHADNLKECWPAGTWTRAPRRAPVLVPRLLDALRQHDVTCTWFVLGWVAENEPKLVAEVAAEGHEIGCHTYSHRLIYEQDPRSFREDLLRATDAIGEIIGSRPTAFRAPSFSITERSLWAFDVLRECGYEVDSSVFPIRRSLYGIPGFRWEPHRLDNGLLEFPPTVAEVAGRHVPASGGEYARLLPNWAIGRLLRGVASSGRQIVFYCHPWEFDTEEPTSEIPSVAKRFRHYVGRRSLLALLQSLLRHFRWGPITQVAEAYVSLHGDSREPGCLAS